MKRKVILYFMMIIILTLGLVLAVFGVAITKYYQQGISNTFQNHAEAINPLWEKGNKLHYGSLEEYSDLIIKNYQYNGAELQLLNLGGELIQSSTGFYKEENFPIDPSVLSFSTVSKKEKIEPSGEKVLAVYIPLVFEGQVVGVLRYISSLMKVQDTITNLLLYGVLICIGVAAIVFLFSLRFADSIVKPVNEIIHVTKEMAEGRFERRVKEAFPHELGEMARTLNYMADEIIKTDRLKNEFISSVSHELRTPLTGIKGWVETMRSPEGLTEEEKQFGLSMIDSESERLMHLVEDLLDFSRYESDRMILDIRLFKLDSLIQEVSFQLRKKASEKSIYIHLDCVPTVIYADRDKVRQVLLNLVDNAIKFSEKGSEIRVHNYIEEESAILEIIDQGVGIKEEELSNIMDSFYKINLKSTGAGLGLAITKKIVQKHNGAMEVTSEFGKGTTVKVCLPLEK